MASAHDNNAPPVQVRHEARVAWLTINRPQARNALDPPTVHALLAAVETLAADHDTRVLVFTGAGDRAFCAGADIKAMRGMDVAAGAAWTRLGHRLMDAVAAVPQPTIAALNGVAAGGGCELALACDLRLMAEGARIGQPEVLLGVIPGWGGTQRLARLVGPGVAKELLYTGRLLEAPEALSCGIVHAVHPESRLLAEAQEMAERLAAQAPLALAAIKQAVDAGADADLAQANQIEIALFDRVFASTDREEGMMAFVDRRPPRFTGA
ncbi:MAG: enoyl-CoA hydratase-related protein [Chloroflexota bacterium]|nr:enoyl-CoA hydratase-related protein [Chloroflexota bacterium]